MKPFVKWAGGKRQILDKIMDIIKVFDEQSNKKYTFIEPFVGGGAVFLALAHDNVIINDINTELINSYNVIRDNPKELMDKLDQHKNKYLKEREHHYYETRHQDRNKDKYDKMSNLDKAARTIFLNKTCFNGLYRVNSNGYFNTPMGRYKNPSMYNKQNILALSNYFNNKNVQIFNDDYSKVVEKAKKHDIIYVDPPYDYGKDNDGFTNYQKEGFVFKDFVRLKKNLDSAIEKKAYVIISNNATERVVELFKDDPNYKVEYIMERFNTNRTINSRADKRKTGLEVLIVGSSKMLPQANSIEKLMKLVRLRNPEILKDNEELKRILDVTTYRQVHYYTRALRFLNLTNVDNEYTDEAIRLRKLNRLFFEKEFAKLILKEEFFNNIYKYEIENNFNRTHSEIARLLKKEYTNLSESTYKRRASTVRKWVDFCKEKLPKHNSF